MRDLIVLAMHGAPSTDFPPAEMAEFFGLHARLEHATGPVDPAARARADALERRMRGWPRTPENDPFWAASKDLAQHLGVVTGCEVLVAFNEFCDPTIEQAVAEAVRRGAERVVVITPMLTRGGEHAERDIPAAIGRARASHPLVRIVYAWPFRQEDIARFLASQLVWMLQEPESGGPLGAVGAGRVPG